MDIDDLDPPEDIAAALGEVSNRLALLERAIAGLAADRARIPDYSETLGELSVKIGTVAQAVTNIRSTPLLRMAGAEWGTEIARAATTARHDDHMLLSRAMGSLDEAARQFSTVAGSARTAERQQNWLRAAGCGGLVLGIAIAVGVLIAAQRIRDDFVSPEKRAAEVLGLGELSAGEHLIRAASPELWQDVLLGDQIVATNRGAIHRCQKLGIKRAQRCVVRIPPN